MDDDDDNFIQARIFVSQLTEEELGRLVKGLSFALSLVTYLPVRTRALNNFKMVDPKFGATLEATVQTILASNGSTLAQG